MTENTNDADKLKKIYLSGLEIPPKFLLSKKPAFSGEVFHQFRLERDHINHKTDYDPRQTPESLPPEALKELNVLVARLEARDAKQITGKEYQLLTEGKAAYRGDLLGVIVATIYTQNGIFYSPWDSLGEKTSIYADPNWRPVVTYANNRAKSIEVCQKFEAAVRQREFVIPSGGSVT